MSAAPKMQSRPVDLRAATPLDTALLAIEAGLWPVAITPWDSKTSRSPGKAPIGQSWGVNRPDADSIRATFRRNPKAGVGLKLGAEGLVVDVDVDDPDRAGEALSRLFPRGLPSTLRWDNADRRFHLLFAYDDRLAALEKTIVKGQTNPDGKVIGNPMYLGLEIRIGAAPGKAQQIQSVIPPSFMVNGAARKWTESGRLLVLPESVIADLEANAHAKAKPSLSIFGGMRAEDNRPSAETRASAYLAKCEPAVSGQDGSGRCFKAAAKMVEFGLTVESAFRLLMAEYNPRCQPPWSEAEMRHKVEDAFRENADRAGAKLEEGRNGTNPPGGPKAKRPPGRPDEKPVVEVNTRRFEVVEKSVEALKADPDLYRRGDFLVTVIREDSNIVHLTSRTAMENVEGSAKIVNLPEAVIGDRLTRHIDFIQWKKDRAGELVAMPAHPPDWLIKTVAVRKHWPGIRPLVAVAECPFPRPDGTIVESPGYDQKTAVLYAPAMKFPAIPKAPTRDDARAAWGRIKRYVRHFPFVGEDDLVVYLAGTLQVLARHGIIGPVPGVAVNGNKAGTGKGLLVDAMVIPGTGRIAPVSKYPYDDEEAGKVKTSIVRSGKTVVSFDNLRESSSYGGPDVDSLITARITDDRILGVSEQTGDLIVRLACFVNGNNIGPVNDAWRRWLVCNLVTELEHPERREDILDEDGNPEKDVDVLMLENRAEIVGDALTILRSHSLAGWPNPGWAPLGSFADWDRVIRGAVWFATDRDCTATQQAAADDAPDHLAKLALLQGWRELPGGKGGQGGATAAEAVKEVGDKPKIYETLRSAMLLKAKGGQLPSSGALGSMLRAIKNTVIGGLRFRENGKRHGAVCWVVEEVGPQARKGECGEYGEADPANPTHESTNNSDIFTSGDTGESCQAWGKVAPQAPRPPRRTSDSYVDPDDPINAPGFRI